MVIEFEALDLSIIAIFSFFSILFSIVDIKSGEIPRIYSIAMLCLVLILKIFVAFAVDYSAHSALQKILSIISGGVFALFAFTLVFLVCRGKMGLADIWFSCGMGMVLGIYAFIVAVLIACVLAFLFYVILFITKKGRRTSRMSLPFIPFLSIGYFCVAGNIAFFIIGSM